MSRGPILICSLCIAACGTVPGDDPAETTQGTESTQETESTLGAEDTQGTDSDGPTGGSVGEGCFEMNVADAGFSLELDGWPIAEEQDEYDITAPCTVLTVEEVGGEVVTTLECDDAGELRPATLRIAIAPEGPPSWGPMSTVMIAYRFIDDKRLDTGIYRSFSLRQTEDQALLVAAVDANTITSGEWVGGAPGEHLDPVQATEDQEYCGGESEELTPMKITLTLDGESLDLVDGQRGTLPIQGQTDQLAVDLAEATVGWCCHYSTWFRLLVRRVE